MKLRARGPRLWTDRVARLLAVAASLGAVAGLVWVLGTVVTRGAAAWRPSLFTAAPKPPGMEGGGLGPAILGSLLITLAAAAVSIPLGLLAGVELAEHGKGRLAGAVRFAADVLMGIPSILVGLFAYTVLVLPLGHFSGWAGALALGTIMFPIVARTTEDMLRLVPDALREAALGLGAPRWRMITGILFRAARRGLITGVLLAVARVAGETAPLLFTALNSPYWPRGLSGPTSNLTVSIFNMAMSPYRDWQQLAWGASLLIVAAVLVLSLLGRYLGRERKG